ncbi:MAG: TIGR02996 domain-containing protein [Planctomycetales bacterium]|nr:TIGR02996 domain-containing protein [Planctomycetales bacterium]
MEHDAAFVRQVRDDPQNDIHRLIYADYLADQQAERGELIRLQVEMSSLDVMDPAWSQARKRVDVLLDEYGEQWLQPLRELGAKKLTKRCFHKGLIERIEMPTTALGEPLAAICQREPALWHLDVQLQSPEDVELLASADLPEQIVIVDLSHNRLSPEDLQRIAESSWLPRVRELKLENCRLTNAALAPLLAVNMPRLETLALTGNALTGDILLPLREWSAIGQLRALRLAGNELRAQGGELDLAHLLSVLTQIEELDLGGNGLNDAQVRQLCDGAPSGTLRRLSLRSNKFGKDGFVALCNAAVFANLELLDVRGNLKTGSYGYGREYNTSDEEVALRERYGDRVKI